MILKFVSNIDKFNNFEDRVHTNIIPTIGVYVMNGKLKYEITHITLDYEKGAAEFYCGIPHYHRDSLGNFPPEVVKQYLE